MTNPDGPNLVTSETLERLRTAGFLNTKSTTCWHAHATCWHAHAPLRPRRRRLLRRSQPQRHSPGNKRP